jgi:2-polyprenyl-6-methoxyphenol hydroxylase-like FAD-dependent oxidoreductase
LAGCATAAPLARAGRQVVVLDRMGFPSDQLSTHLLMPAGTSELAKLGALPRILELKPSRVRWIRTVVEGIVALERLRPAADGIDYGVCVPRDLQDVQLVRAAREQGADVREHCTVQSLRWRGGRVVGVRYRDGAGAERELASTLLVGADGLFAGRTLAEQVLPVLDDADAVDRATRAWEAARDRECLPAYHFANRDTRVERQPAVVCELVREAARTTDADISDLVGRARTPQQIVTVLRAARALAAMWRGEQPRLKTLGRLLPDVRTELAVRLEQRAGRFRSTRTIVGSEHPGAVWPAPPKPAHATPTAASATAPANDVVGTELLA